MKNCETFGSELNEIAKEERSAGRRKAHWLKDRPLNACLRSEQHEASTPTNRNTLCLRIGCARLANSCTTYAKVCGDWPQQFGGHDLTSYSRAIRVLDQWSGLRSGLSEGRALLYSLFGTLWLVRREVLAPLDNRWLCRLSAASHDLAFPGPLPYLSSQCPLILSILTVHSPLSSLNWRGHSRRALHEPVQPDLGQAMFQVSTRGI